MKQDIDERAEELGLSRSAYIQMLIRRDLGDTSVSIAPRVTEEPAAPYQAKPADSTPKPKPKRKPAQ